MIKIWRYSITIPLELIFQQSLKEKKFPELRKKANIVHVHIKEDKNLIKNYRPVSLLPIFSKIFERVIYNALFNYFKDRKLFTPSQSGFLPGNSCIAGAHPDYIHLCKCWSHIFSGKIIKKIQECPFSPPNYCLLFFCQLKRLESLRPRVCCGYSAEDVERLCMPTMR